MKTKNKDNTTMNHIYQEQQFGPNWFGFDDIYKEQVELAHDDSHFVEVGCFMGKSSSYMCVEIINSGKQIQFDMIDTWEGSVEHQELEVVKNKLLYDVFRNNMKPFEGIRNFRSIRMASVDAAKIYEDNSLDFVFIDASHDEENVMADIDAWFPKVKKDGILAGDDWGFEGVVRGVQNKFLNTQYEIRGRSWIVQNNGS